MIAHQQGENWYRRDIGDFSKALDVATKEVLPLGLIL